MKDQQQCGAVESTVPQEGLDVKCRVGAVLQGVVDSYNATLLNLAVVEQLGSDVAAAHLEGRRMILDFVGGALAAIMNGDPLSDAHEVLRRDQVLSSIVTQMWILHQAGQPIPDELYEALEDGVAPVSHSHSLKCDDEAVGEEAVQSETGDANPPSVAQTIKEILEAAGLSIEDYVLLVPRRILG